MPRPEVEFTMVGSFVPALRASGDLPRLLPAASDGFIDFDRIAEINF